MSRHNHSELLQKIHEEMGDAWVQWVVMAAKHEYDQHKEYHGRMSKNQYAEVRVIEQYNHVMTALHYAQAREHGKPRIEKHWRQL